MFDFCWDIPLDEEVISGADGYLLRDPPVIGIKADRRRTCDAIHSDLIAASNR